MIVRALFSYNNKIGSYAIRAGSFLLDDSGLNWANTPSHTAILIDGIWVVESIMSKGVRIIPYHNWKLINTEVASVAINNYKEYPTDLINEIWGKSYDFLALMWFIKAVFCAKILKRGRPSINEYESENKFFCVELVGRCVGVENYGTITPAELLANIFKPDGNF